MNISSNIKHFVSWNNIGINIGDKQKQFISSFWRWNILSYIKLLLYTKKWINNILFKDNDKRWKADESDSASFWSSNGSHLLGEASWKEGKTSACEERDKMFPWSHRNQQLCFNLKSAWYNNTQRYRDILRENDGLLMLWLVISLCFTLRKQQVCHFLRNKGQQYLLRSLISSKVLSHVFSNSTVPVASSLR